MIKSSSVSSAKPGDTATFTLTYTNNGSQPLLNLVLRDSLSPYTPFSSANPPLDAGFPDGSGTLQWTIPGSLAAGASGTVSCSVQIK